MRKYMRGVTLLELLIVVVIIGILTAIAYPNYRQYIIRSTRTEAKEALSRIAIYQERFYLQNHIYTQDLTQLGFDTTPTFTTASGSYAVSVGTANANTFTATALYDNADPDETGKCASFQIDDRGAKTSAPEADCWTRTR